MIKNQREDLEECGLMTSRNRTTLENMDSLTGRHSLETNGYT